MLGISAGRYGMGWFDIDLGQTKTFSHGGNVPDFSAFMALVPEQKRGVVLLAQRRPLWTASDHWRRLGWT